MQAAGEQAADDPVGRIGHAYEVWRGEGGQHRHGHDYRIDGRIEHSEAHAEGGYDESEFADLCQGESGFDGHLQVLAGDEHTEGAEQYHAEDHDSRQHKDRRPVLRDDVRIHHHADGYEEY